MPIELEFTKLEDPFLRSSSFSLIPKTLAARSGSTRVDTLEDLFESLVAKGAPKMMQQAQIISNSFGSIDSLYKEDGNIDANCKNRGQERRPGLGRKRARFSIKPDVSSYPEPDTNISSSIDDIDDPDEYFKAFEQKQNADKELQKLRGGALMDVTQQDQGTKTRQRRPGLLGKRPSYKHRISEDDAMAETLAKSQDDDALNCSSSLINRESVDGPKSQANNTDNKLQEAELEDSVLANENNKLDDLISYYKDLDKGEDETFMREILHLKPIDVGKMQVPVLPNLSFSQHSALKRTTHAQSEHFDKMSPSARSPLVSLSILKKRMSKNLQDDIISSFHIEDSSPDSSSSKSAGKKSITSDKLESEDVIYFPIAETDRVIELSENHSLSARNTHPKSVGRRIRKGSILDDSHGNLQEQGPLIFDESEAEVRRHDSQPKTQEVLEDTSHLIGENANDDFNASKKDNNVTHADGCLRDDGGSSPSEFLISNEIDARNEILVASTSKSSNSGINSKTPLSEVDANLQKNMPDVRISQEESCPAEVTVLTNQDQKNQHDVPENNTEEHALVPPPNEVRKQKAPKRAPNKKEYSRKKNVAESACPPEATDFTNLPSENQQLLPDQNNEHDSLIDDESEAQVCHDSQPKTQEVLKDASHLVGENAKDNFNASKKYNNEAHADGRLAVDVGADLHNNMPDVRTSQEESCPAEVTILTNQHLENQHELRDNNTKDHALVPPSNDVREQKAPKRAPNKRKYNRKQNVAENSSPPEVTDNTNLPSENQQVLPDKDNEHQVASTLPSNEIRKQKPRSRSKSRKDCNRRQSLAGAGTVWEAGKRKSSRHKFRPLEHWNGERLLYGRIHNSLATVIGVKYASPGQEHLKIKSYVPDEFADLVAKAARC